MSESTTAVVTPTSELAEAFRLESGVDVNLCFQCNKCTAGCPTSYAMDYSPAQLIHAVRLGLDDLILHSRTMWMCAACETCTTRCPQDVDIAKVMDAAKIIARRRGIQPPAPAVASFYRSGLFTIRLFGRMYEIGMMMMLKMLTRDFFKDMGLGMKMMRKGKLKMIPSMSIGRTIAARRLFSRVKKKEKRATR
jgi:heterodisulfide reductase subunit C